MENMILFEKIFMKYKWYFLGGFIAIIILLTNPYGKYYETQVENNNVLRVSIEKDMNKLLSNETVEVKNLISKLIQLKNNDEKLYNLVMTRSYLKNSMFLNDKLKNTKFEILKEFKSIINIQTYLNEKNTDKLEELNKNINSVLLKEYIKNQIDFIKNRS